MTARRAALVSFLLAGVLGALGVASAFAAPRRAPAELMPDLVTLPFDGISIHQEGARTVLRFGNTIGNQGLGVLELRPRRRDCNGDGDFTNDRLAIERIYEDTNASGAFERGTDLIGRTVEVGCMVFHPAHHHWHLQRFARYELRSIATGDTVVASPKVSFCVRDSLVAFADLPGFSVFAYYGECKRNSITGLSVGWADWYGAFLPGQDLDVTGLPNGRYCLTSTADPQDGIDEADETNNVRSRLLRLADGTVEDLGVSC
jgi:Lysyl oxidase